MDLFSEKNTPLIMFNQHVLVLTSLGMLLPCFYTSNVYFIGLFSACSWASAMFWANHRRNSTLHLIDAFLARVGITTVIVYKCFVNTTNFWLFSLLTATTFYFVYMSNVASNTKWGSREHMIYHTYSHIFIIMSGVVAFLPDVTLYIA